MHLVTKTFPIQARYCYSSWIIIRTRVHVLGNCWNSKKLELIVFDKVGIWSNWLVCRNALFFQDLFLTVFLCMYMVVGMSSRVEVPVEVRERIGFSRVGVTGGHESGCCLLNLVLHKCRGSSHLLSYPSPLRVRKSWQAVVNSSLVTGYLTGIKTPIPCFYAKWSLCTHTGFLHML